MALLNTWASQQDPNSLSPLDRALNNYIQQGDAPLAYLMRGDAQGLLKDLNTPKPVNTTQDMTDLALNLVGSINSMGNVTKGLLSKTQFEKAQEIASKNAETLLGLPKGNTAMDRAKAMGYNTPAYHGTNVQFSEFGPNSWFTTEPKYASDYAYVLQPSGTAEAPQVIPTLLNLGKTKEAQMFTTTDDVMKALGKKNTDSFTLSNVGGGSSSHYVIKDPSNIRSQFAAFDPARANEPDLLAATMAIPVSGLLQEPKEKKKKK